MALLLFFLLIGSIEEVIPHIIFKETPRLSRVSYNEWRPLRQTTGQIVRYPVYKKIYGPTKKDPHDLAVDGSEHVIQQFSPAPPSILGPLSVFGHATVKGRQHATHVTKQSARPVLDTRTYYQPQHKHVAPYLIYKDPPIRVNHPAAAPFKRQPPIFTDERSPNSHFQQQAQSTSLAANSYYFEQQGPPPFIPSIRDHSFEKVRKPSADAYNVQYSLPTLDYQGLTFYTPNNYQDLYRNPFGDIQLGDISNRKPVSPINDPPSPSDHLYDSAVSIGKPFHSSIPSSKPAGTYNPIVTTYSTLSSSSPPAPPAKLNTIKFSQVAQPFQVVTSKPLHENDFTESVYPLSVTTIDVPEPVINNNDASIENDGFVPSFPNFHTHTYNQTPESTGRITINHHHKPQAPIASSEVPFLPTPATDSWLNKKSEENNDELTTQHQYADTTENDADDDVWPTVMTTVPAPVETTTTKKVKSRRRPTRRPTVKVTNERVTEDPVTTIDYNKFNRRRKPVNKNYSYSEMKRLRTTSTTSPTPPIEDTTVFSAVAEFATEPMIFTSISNPNAEQAGQDSLSIVKFEETTSDSVSPVSSTTELPTTTSQFTTTASSISAKMRLKYGNRPRFSVKDYRERLRMSSSTTPIPDTNEQTTRTRSETKTKSRLSSSSKEDSSDDTEVTTEHKYRYKPRLNPPRYKSSTTTISPADTTTTERINSFKPSGNRYKSSGGKYFSRYRTSTVSSKEVEENLTTVNPRITIKTKGVFSAKRRPFPIKQNLDEPATEEEETHTEIFKIKENEVIPSSPTKSIDETGSIETTISSHEINMDPTGDEAKRIADLTSASTNEFHQSSIVKPNRRRPSIILPRDEPILPLEAFFQTQTKD